MSDELSPVDGASRPRILATESDFDRARRLVKTDDRVASWFDVVKSNADSLLEEPPNEYEIPDDKRLLGTSRSVLQRVLDLGTSYKLTGDEQYADRLGLELDTAADFPDWNPSHFLDTAEMTAAFAVGYDWLREYWSEEETSRFADAMVEHGLRVALPGYRSDDLHDDLSWMHDDNNWNTVCNGGLTLGALALLGDDHGYGELLSEVIEGARSSIHRPITAVGPNGGWEEGVTYWGYNAKYLVFYLASLENTLGADFGFTDRPGVENLGDFPIQMTSPTNLAFRFGDAGLERPSESALLWIAGRFDRPTYAGYHLETLEAAIPDPPDRAFAMNVLWYDPDVVAGLDSAELDRERRFPGGDESAVARTAWGDPNAAFFGFKAGNNQAGHGDLDVGTFVFDANGVRWACDVGANSYEKAEPAYWEYGPDGRRWQFYRKRAEGHNTLVVGPDGGPDQDPLADCSIQSLSSDDESVCAIADLSGAYPGAEVRRGVGLLDGRTELVVRDEVDAGGTDVWWFMHTEAEVTTDGRTATLQREGERVRAAIVSPDDATFEVMDATPLATTSTLEEDEPVEGVRKLAVHVPDARTTAIEVRVGSSVHPSDTSNSLEGWAR
ncbi:MAG: heparinase II/III family protein [Halobacteriales archaeon]